MFPSDSTSTFRLLPAYRTGSTVWLLTVVSHQHHPDPVTSTVVWLRLLLIKTIHPHRRIIDFKNKQHFVPDIKPTWTDDSREACCKNRKRRPKMIPPIARQQSLVVPSCLSVCIVSYYAWRMAFPLGFAFQLGSGAAASRFWRVNGQNGKSVSKAENFLLLCSYLHTKRKIIRPRASWSGNRKAVVPISTPAIDRRPCARVLPSRNRVM